ncbi:MAG: alpha/beta hydrolase [Aliidongia sp.]
MRDPVFDPDMAAIVAAFLATVPPGPKDLAQMRRRVADYPLPTRSTPIARVEDLTIPGPTGPLTARLYAPAEGAPLIVFYHGGGWVLCSIDTHDSLCRALAAASGAAVLSIDYRLAPEHKFPAAFEDAMAALVWAAANAAALGCDPTRLAVAGDSAGGNLAAAAALAAPAAGIRLAHQLLVYPALDPMQRGPSHARYLSGVLLDAPSMAWYWEQYLRDSADRLDPRAAPGLAPSYGVFPPTTLVLAEHDPLFDDGIDFANGLRAAGIATEILRYDGVTHGFLSMFGMVAKAETAFADIGKALRRALAPA